MARRDGDGGTPPAALGEMIRGALLTQLLYVAARLDLPERLRAGPRPAAALAAAVGADPGALARLLRALAFLGVVREEAGAFALTPAGARLQAGAPGSLRGSALFYGAPWSWQAFGALLEAVRTGIPAFRTVHGTGLFEYLARHPEAAETFNEHMLAVTGQDAEAIVAAYDFGGLGRIVDVGGGHGALLAAILRRVSAARGVLFDRASVVEGAREFLGAAGLADRCELRGGSFFEAVPPDGDCYLLKDILHDWDDERALAVLRACRRAMAPAARLLVIERVLPADGTPAPGALVDVVMLVLTGGQERTEREYRALLAAAGLRLTRAVPTASPMTVLEAGHP